MNVSAQKFVIPTMTPPRRFIGLTAAGWFWTGYTALVVGVPLAVHVAHVLNR